MAKRGPKPQPKYKRRSCGLDIPLRESELRELRRAADQEDWAAVSAWARTVLLVRARKILAPRPSVTQERIQDSGQSAV
jgi:hypothetical protein